MELNDHHFCAVSTTDPAGTCKGDSGGPLVREVDVINQVFTLVGVTSFGLHTCGSSDFPLGFTKIEGYISLWLQGLIEADLPLQT